MEELEEFTSLKEKYQKYIEEEVYKLELTQ